MSQALEQHTGHSFKYETLDSVTSSIRILELLPGELNTPLSCQIHTAFLDDRPHYEAISYVWGDPTPCVPITCDNARHNITRNLADALFQMRHLTQSRMLWADAICIDQGSDGEKSHQVNMMGQIYAKAARVLAWLGPDEEDHAARAIPFVDRVFADIGGNHYKKALCDGPKPEDYVDENVWRSLGKITQKPWFTRIWVLQEIGLAENCFLLCGPCSVDWKILATVNYWVISNTTLLFFERYGIESDRIWNMSEFLKEETFSGVLRSASSSVATDPRDMVYALLGHPAALGFEDGRPMLLADYSLSIEDVRLQTTLAVIKQEACLDSLRYVEFNGNVVDESSACLPSWVSLWDAGHSFSFRQECFGFEHPARVFHLANDVRGFSFDSTCHILSIQGMLFDRVQCVSGTHNILPWRFQSTHQLWDWLQMNSPSADYRTGDTLFDAFKLAIVGCQKPDDYAHRVFGRNADFSEQSTSYWESLISSNSDTSDIPDLSDDESFNYSNTHSLYAAQVKYICQSRQMFVTSEGYIGLGPEFLSSEDIIVFIKGVIEPLALRRVEDQCILIGVCYIQGFAYEDAMNPEWRAKTPTQEFQIR